LVSRYEQLIDNRILFNEPFFSSIEKFQDFYGYWFYWCRNWVFFILISLVWPQELLQCIQLDITLVFYPFNKDHQIETVKTNKHVLVTNGIYKIFRHPSYFGWFVYTVSLQLMMSNFISTILFTYVSWRFFDDSKFNF
jgi:hypothetical protein